MNAKWYRDYFRPKQAAVYNQSQLNAQVLLIRPRQAIDQTNSSHESSGDEQNSTDDNFEDEPTHTNSSNRSTILDEIEDIEQNSSDHSTLFDENVREQTEKSSDANNEEQEGNDASVELTRVSQDDEDVKLPLQTVQLNAIEASVFNNMFDESNDVGNACIDQQVADEHITISPGGTKKVTKNIGDDCEMSFDYGQDMFKPANVGYQVKINDLLSDNIPFKENVILNSIKFFQHL